MDYDLGPTQSRWALLLSPGPLLALVGLTVLTISFVVFSGSSSGGDVDAILEAQAQTGTRLKSMLAMVVGVVITLAGALWGLLSFKNR